jgi:hypothetical protein
MIWVPREAVNAVSGHAVVERKAAALALHRFDGSMPSPGIGAVRYWLISIVFRPERLPSTCRQARKRRPRYLIFKPSGLRSKTWRCAFGIGHRVDAGLVTSS